MRRCGLMIVLLFPATCLAAPWSYDLPIGDGYSITVSTTVSVVSKGNRGVLDPGNDRSSRIDRYATTRGHVFIRAYPTFFVLDKANDSVTGPLSESEFAQHPVVLASGKLKWKEPHPPFSYTLFFLLLFLVNPIFCLLAVMTLLFVVAIPLMVRRVLRHVKPEALD
jgi:hypothetical protein